MTQNRSDNSTRVLLLAGGALAVLFFLGGSLVLNGAITGLGMFVGIMVLLCYSDKLSNFVTQSKMGPITDLGITFGLPALISIGLGIKGQTMLIATLTCGLMFTFWLNGKRSRTVQSSMFFVSDFVRGFLGRLGVENGQHAEVGRRAGNQRHRPGCRGQRQEIACQGREAGGAWREARRGPRGSDADGVIDLVPGEDYFVRK